MEYNPKQCTTNLLQYPCHIYAKICIRCYIGDLNETDNLSLGSLVFEKNLKNHRLTIFLALPLVGKHFWTTFLSHKTKRTTQMKSKPLFIGLNTCGVTLTPPYNLSLGNLVFENNLKNHRLTIFLALPLVGKHFWTTFLSHKTKRTTLPVHAVLHWFSSATIGF